MNTQDFAALICNELRNGTLPGLAPYASPDSMIRSLRCAMEVAHLCEAVARNNGRVMAMFCTCLHREHTGMKCGSCGCVQSTPFDIDGKTNIRGSANREVHPK